jgi:histidinol-phosphate aminotransferase
MTLTVRQHGGTDALGAVIWDFSTNSNSCGPCPMALTAVQGADASRYPDPHYVQLRAQLARFHGVATSRVVLAVSASEFIFRFTAWMAQQGATRVWLPAAAYADYAHAAAAWRLQPCTRQADAQLVWACEPSSPLGQAHAQWPDWLSGGTPGCQHLVLDCAYAPLRLAGQPSLDGAQRDQVWQLYSPNKALGLTGVRAAYAIAPLAAHDAVQQLDALAPSWPVGAHGVALLQAWTSPAAQDWLQQCLPRLQAWKTSQVQMLQSLGWHCLPSEASFFCARPPLQMALDGWLRLLRATGIKLRDATSLGMPGHVRMSVHPPPAQRALAQALFALQDSLEVTP